MPTHVRLVAGPETPCPMSPLTTKLRCGRCKSYGGENNEEAPCGGHFDPEAEASYLSVSALALLRPSVGPIWGEPWSGVTSVPFISPHVAILAWEDCRSPCPAPKRPSVPPIYQLLSPLFRAAKLRATHMCLRSQARREFPKLPLQPPLVHRFLRNLKQFPLLADMVFPRCVPLSHNWNL